MGTGEHVAGLPQAQELFEVLGHELRAVDAPSLVQSPPSKAVNEHGGFGKWTSEICFNPSDLPTVIHNAAAPV
jgi:hypothetical protein